MRIVGGTLRGRRFDGPKGQQTRPTSDRVRESVSSALQVRGLFDSAIVLDLFAGTGALAFEALSRGARRAVLADAHRGNAKAIGHNANQLGLGDRIQVLTIDLLAAPTMVAKRLNRMSDDPYNLVFADPPYRLGHQVLPLLCALVAANAVAADAAFVLEHACDDLLPLPAGLASVARYRYGNTRVELMTACGPEGADQR